MNKYKVMMDRQQEEYNAACMEAQDEKTIMEELCVLISERAEELSKNPKVRKKMFGIYITEGKEPMRNYIYRLAIATLYGKGGD